MFKRLTFAVLVLAPALALGACRSRAQEGALIGSAVGAGAGYIIGNEMDKDDRYDDDYRYRDRYRDDRYRHHRHYYR